MFSQNMSNVVVHKSEILRGGRTMSREKELISEYGLDKHPEGGWFSESYTSADTRDGRPLSGSIYFLLRSVIVRVKIGII